MITTPIKIILVEDSSQLRNTLVKNLSLFEEVKILYTAENGKDALIKLKEYTVLPDVILMDIDMPLMNGIQATHEIKKRYANQIKIIMLTVFDDDDKLFDAIVAGAMGYLIKDDSVRKIIDAIKNVVDGGLSMSPSIAHKTIELLKKTNKTPQAEIVSAIGPENYNLTPREIEVLELLAGGKTYKKIADELFVSDKTIKKHIENIYTKLHVNSKMEAVFLAQKYNWYSPLN